MFSPDVSFSFSKPYMDFQNVTPQEMIVLLSGKLETFNGNNIFKAGCV